jgi:hypothetical protein
MTDWKLIERAIRQELLLIQELDSREYSCVKVDPIYYYHGSWRYNATDNHMTPDFLRETYIEYKEPKKKIKKYLWAYVSADGKDHKIAFNGELLSVERLNEDIVIKNNRKKNYFKIENTMIEVDE